MLDVHGVGYELLNLSYGDTGSDTAGGVNFDVAAGVDLNAGRFQFGPFVQFKAGQFNSFSDSSGDTIDTNNTAWHDWFMIGLRSRYWGG